MRRLVGLLAAAVVLVPAPARAASYIPPVHGPIIRHYEPPPTKYSPGHRGIDIGAPSGTSVVASAGGVVAFAGPIGGQKYVSIDHPDGIRTTYSYLSVIHVKAKQAVAQGVAIGRSGTGHPGSTEPSHLHFGAKRGEEYLDPEPLLLEGFKHDYSSLVRLVPDSADEGASKVGVAFLPLAALLPLWRARRAVSRVREGTRRANARSSSGSSGDVRGRNGPLRASSDGR